MHWWYGFAPWGLLSLCMMSHCLLLSPLLCVLLSLSLSVSCLEAFWVVFNISLIFTCFWQTLLSKKAPFSGYILYPDCNFLWYRLLHVSIKWMTEWSPLSFLKNQVWLHPKIANCCVHFFFFSFFFHLGREKLIGYKVLEMIDLIYNQNCNYCSC